MTVPTIHLNNGTTIPQLGFGVFQIEPENTVEAVTRAFEAGYRHIDTAEMYGNEKEVGEAIAASGIPRDEIYVTSKLNNGFHRQDDARRAFDDTLSKLGLEKIDLFLVHWPLPTRYDGDYVSTWQTMASFVEDGRAASVGVSNFQPAHLQRIIDETGVVPAVNQVEVHPFFGNEDARAANASHGIATEAWSPIAQGKVLDDDVIAEIAKAKDRSTAQVTLRWHIERGDIVFPKSVTPERIEENFDLFSFELTPRRGLPDLRARPGRGRPHRPEPRPVRLHPRLTGRAGPSGQPRASSSPCTVTNQPSSSSVQARQAPAMSSRSRAARASLVDELGWPGPTRRRGRPTSRPSTRGPRGWRSTTSRRRPAGRRTPRPAPSRAAAVPRPAHHRWRGRRPGRGRATGPAPGTAATS